MEPTSGLVETPDVRLHYVDWGGDGPPLMLVHATGFHGRLWDPYARALRDRFRVICYDQRGHGDSGLADNGYGWYRFADDIHAVINHLGIEGCFAAGHSSGGATCIASAGRYPGSISRVLLIDPVLPLHWEERAVAPNPMAEGTRKRRALWASPAQFAETLGTRGNFARWRREYLELYAQHGLRPRADGQYELKCAPEVEAQVYEAVRTHNPWPDVDRATVPVFLLRALGTPQRPATAGPELVQRIPNCREQTVDCSHFIPMEEPETVLAAIEAWFGEALT